MYRLIRFTALGLIGVLVLVWGTVWVAHLYPDGQTASVVQRVARWVGRSPDGTDATALSVGGPFHLTDQSGQAVTDATFRGRWMLVYFGYTTCPDVCPTELQTIAAALSKLGPEADKIAPIFVTVDPARDTPAVLDAYLKLFDKRLIGLTGTDEQTASIARAYRVYYAKVTPQNASTYLMDHSSFIYLMDPAGHFRALFTQGTSVDELVAGIQDRVTQKS